MINKEDDTICSFLDVLLCFICVVTAIMSLLQVRTEEIANPSVKENSVYKITMEWSAEGEKLSQDDVDLWVKDPDGNICSFNRREAGETALISLDHDDIGTNQAEGTENHIEIVNIRGVVEGEYIVNCHYYAKRTTNEHVEVTAKLVRQKPFQQVIKETVKLHFSGDEKTFFRFSLDKHGEVIDTNRLPASIVDVSTTDGTEDYDY